MHEASVNDGLVGLLCIGDPHLSSRAPGFRKDDYPRAIMEKLRWAMEYARGERLLPVILGDVFDFPRDNANWLLVEAIKLLGEGVPAVYGNHDCHEDAPGDNDSITVLLAAGAMRLLTMESPWRGVIGGREMIVGGTSWGRKLPERFDAGEGALVVWIAHHDVRFPGYEEAARFGAFEIPGVDLVINGHIHRPLEDVVVGGTTWVNPGNIARVRRSDATREHVPSVLRVDIDASGSRKRHVALPHSPFDEVFHPDTFAEQPEAGGNAFIKGLSALESMRTAGGAGLRAFLEANLATFESPVAKEIWLLAEEVLKDGYQSDRT